jgi:7-cyano-7-deazaguanine synthase
MKIVCLSGGLDSAVVLARYIEQGEDVVAMYFRYDHPSTSAEENCATRLCARFGVELIYQFIEPPNSGIMTGGDDPVVIGRNTIMLANACAEAQARGASAVGFGATAEDLNGFPDCRPTFFDAFNAVQAAIGGVPVETPLIDWRKGQIKAEAARLSIGDHETISCYAPKLDGHKGWLPCGACLSCEVRG